jgi:DNA-binding LacI/PurR family transcriptional regulator
MTGISTIKKHKWLHQEIRRSILNQKLPAGYKLPTDNEIMEKYRLSRATVIHAMKSLEEDGLICRKPGSGTFVQNKLQTGEFAVVVENLSLDAESTPIWNMTIARVLDAVRGQYSTCRAKVHVVSWNYDAHELRNCDLLDPQVVGDLRGVFTLQPLHNGVAEELARRGIPSIFLISKTFPFHPYQIYFDLQEVYRQTFNHLAEVGCRSVGILGESFREDAAKYFSQFSDTLGKSGLEYRPEWMLHRSTSFRMSEKAGWELFHRFWKQKNRPDAIFVPDDLKLGVRFPEDIRVVTVTPHGAPLPYSKAVTAVELDVQLLARTAVDMMDTLLRGDEPAKPLLSLPVSLVKGDTT